MDTRIRDFFVSLGKALEQGAPTFTTNPAEIAEEMARHVKKSEDELIDFVIQECRELVEHGLMWFSGSNHLYIKRHSCLTVRSRHLLRLIERAKTLDSSITA